VTPRQTHFHTLRRARTRASTHARTQPHDSVIGIGIALHIFFGWPYYVGVLLSPITTMLFLATQEAGGMRYMEAAIVFFIGVMSITMWVEQSEVPQKAGKLMEGWVYGFALEGGSDIFAIIGVIGAVVMPHNLYLHTASVMSRPVSEGQQFDASASLDHHHHVSLRGTAVFSFCDIHSPAEPSP
jgi:NRAMP (natural resistance-associated macrophage protein)-like metal ion transporter